MKYLRLLIVPAILGTATLIPAVAHATTYKHFTSKGCAYSIDYPSNWKVKAAKSATQNDTFDGGQALVSIGCVNTSPSIKVSQLMKSEISSYKKAKYNVLHSSTTKNGGRLDLSKDGAYSILFFTHGAKATFLMFALGTSQKVFKANEATFVHMHGTMKVH